MENNRIHPADDVRVELWFNGKEIDAWQSSGFHTVSQSVRAAYEATDRANLNIEDYIFTVKNLATGTSARYRINAGDHLRILPEE